MISWQLAEIAWKADAVSVSACAVAIFVLLVASVRRGGGIDQGYIIDVFSIVATIGTALKLAFWMSESVQGNDPAAPGGTDLLLAVGALIAILYGALQQLGISTTGDATKASLGSRAYRWAVDTLPAQITSVVRVVVGPSAPAKIGESPRAKTIREKQLGPGSAEADAGLAEFDRATRQALESQDPPAEG